MVKLKRSLNKQIKLILIFFSLLFSLSCSPIKPTYEGKDVAKNVAEISKKEYGVEVKTKLVGNTLWVYIPFSNLLDNDDNLDKEVSKKISNILAVIHRLILSSDKPPGFYCLVASDIGKIGADYIILGYSLDVKKGYCGALPWTEMNKRYIISAGINPYALADKEGDHILQVEISLPKFLAALISQRAKLRLKEEKFNAVAKSINIRGNFTEDTFRFELELEGLKEGYDETELFKEVARVTKEIFDNYEFKDFLLVEIEDTKTTQRLTLSRLALREIR